MSTAAPSRLEESVPAAGPVRKSGIRGGKFLTFFLAGEEYGLEILKVQEIVGVMPITRVPCTQTFVRGVINLRGKIIPVIDLRLRFQMPAAEQTEETCIIVVQTRGIPMGIVVDQVSEVLDIPTEEIEETPPLGSAITSEFILGIGKSEERVRILLDIDRVLSPEQMVDLCLAVAENPGGSEA